MSQSGKPVGTLEEMNGSSSEKADIGNEMEDDLRADQTKLMAAKFVTKKGFLRSRVGRTPSEKGDERTLEHLRHVGSRTKTSQYSLVRKQIAEVVPTGANLRGITGSPSTRRIGLALIEQRSDPCEENSHHQQNDGVDQEGTWYF